MTGNPNAVKPNSPGQLPFHYSPHTSISFLNDALFDRKKKIGAIFFKENRYSFAFTSVKILSSSGDLREAAAKLFSYLHEMENEGLDLILVEAIEEKGLGRAIMDRLKKATNKA